MFACTAIKGLGITVEKGLRINGRVIRNLGDYLESLAIVDAMTPEAGTIMLCEQ